MTIIRDKKGQFISVPDPKFFDGQIVTTSKDYFSPKEITMLVEPHWALYPNNEAGGWVYGEKYCHIDKTSNICVQGGCGFSFEEKSFLPLSNSTHKLIAEIYYREQQVGELERKMSELESELNKLRYALELLA